MKPNPEDPPWRSDYDALEALLGYAFRDRGLLRVALTHSSHANETAAARSRKRSRSIARDDGEQGVEADDSPVPTEVAGSGGSASGPGARVPSNERLEFLGDAVIGLAVAQQLYELHPDWQEGDLTRGLHDLVDRNSLAAAAGRIELGSWLQLGRTELQSGGSKKNSILSDAMEAVLGAVYLDGGLDAVIVLLRVLFGEALSADAPRVSRDPKTLLQESVMAAYGEFPSYRLAQDSGIEGDEHRFGVRVLVKGEQWGEGTARSKRNAERAAAVAGLEHLEALERAQSEPEAPGPDACEGAVPPGPDGGEAVT